MTRGKPAATKAQMLSAVKGDDRTPRRWNWLTVILWCVGIGCLVYAVTRFLSSY